MPLGCLRFVIVVFPTISDMIDAFNTILRYFDDILNITIIYFDNMVSQIYPSELQLNKANTPDTEASFMG